MLLRLIPDESLGLRSPHRALNGFSSQDWKAMERDWGQKGTRQGFYNIPEEDVLFLFCWTRGCSAPPLMSCTLSSTTC